MQDRGVLHLYDPDYTWLNEDLAKHYGIKGVRGDYMRRVSLPADSPRRGLLGMGSILTATSVANRTSPVIRGHWILANLIGAPPPPPPPNVPALVTEPATEGRPLSMRDAMAALVDMHDLGDMMVQAGWADPVVDQETLTLTWSSAADALADWRSAMKPRKPPMSSRGYSAAVAAPTDYRISALMSGYKWGSTTITYSFYSNAVFNGSYYGTETVSEVSPGVKANVRAIMAWYSTMMNINLVEVNETANNIGLIRIMDSTAPGYAYAYYPYSTAMFDEAGDVHLQVTYDFAGSNTNGFQNPAGEHGYVSLIHEIGHALGLKHPHDSTPNLSTAEHNPHSPLEWSCLEELTAAAEMLVELAAVWARGGK